MKSIFTGLLLVIAVAGCNTTNSLLHLSPDYSALPEAELNTLASEVETIVHAGETDFKLENPAGLIVDSPEMNQALRTRVIRQPLVAELLDSGFAAEERSGLIAIKRSSAYKKATTSRQRDREALLVMSENRDRWTLYEGMIEANGWEPRSLSAVQETFFRARVPLLTPGQQHAEVQ